MKGIYLNVLYVVACQKAKLNHVSNAGFILNGYLISSFVGY